MQDIITVKDIYVDVNDSLSHIEDGLFIYEGKADVSRMVYKHKGKIYLPNLDILGYNEVDKEHYITGNFITYIKWAYNLNYIDALLLPFLLNADLNPDINQEMLREELGINEPIKSRYLDNYDLRFYHSRPALKSNIRVSRTSITKYLKQSVFDDSMFKGKYTLKMYKELLEPFDGNLTHNLLIRENSQGTNLLDSNIDFKTLTVEYTEVTNTVTGKAKTVKLNLKELMRCKDLVAHKDEVLDTSINKIEDIYIGYLKHNGIELNDRILKSVVNLVWDKDLDVNRVLYTQLAENLYSGDSGNTEQDDIVRSIRYDYPYRVEKVRESDTYYLFYLLLSIDKLYKHCLNDPTMSMISNVIHRDLNWNIGDMNMFPYNLYDKKEEYTMKLPEGLQDKFDELEELYSDMCKNNQQNRVWSNYRNGKSGYIWCHNALLHTELKKEVTVELRDALLDKVSDIMVPVMMSEVKKKVWNYIFNFDKQKIKMFEGLQTHQVKNALLILKHVGYFEGNHQDINLKYLIEHDVLQCDFDTIIHRHNEIQIVHLKEVFDDNKIKFKEYLSILKYLSDDCKYRQGITRGIDGIYDDYLRMSLDMIENNYNTFESLDFKPYSIKMAHDVVDRDYKSIKVSMDEERFTSSYTELQKLDNKLVHSGETKKLRLYIPKTTEDIRDEGKNLHHCVGSYVSSIINKESFILFLRDESTPQESLYTVELKQRIPGVYSLGQTKGYHNREMPSHLKPKIKKIVERYIHNKNIEQGELL